MRFTFDSYSELIKLIKREGYAISNYQDYDNYDKVVIIKHDVDMSLGKAFELARLENQLGIRTIYNVLLCSNFYNPYSKKSIEYIRGIETLGHEIGLHFDEVRYERAEDIVVEINNEIALLEKYINGNVRSFSMHRPSAETLKANYIVNKGKTVNTYSETFFREFKYVSDSRRNWQEDPIETVTCGKYSRIHILTHPIWYTQDEEDIAMRLEDFLQGAISERYENMKENIRDLESIITL